MKLEIGDKFIRDDYPGQINEVIEHFSSQAQLDFYSSPISYRVLYCPNDYFTGKTFVTDSYRITHKLSDFKTKLKELL